LLSATSSDNPGRRASGVNGIRNTRQAGRMNQTPAVIINITKTTSTTVSINSKSTSLIEALNTAATAAKK